MCDAPLERAGLLEGLLDPRTGLISTVLVPPLLLVTRMLSAVVGVPIPVKVRVPRVTSIVAAIAAGAHRTNMDSNEASIPVTATTEMVRSLASAFVFIVIL